MRSDIMERKLELSGFNEGPIQGYPTDGHSVTVQMDKGEDHTGELFDRAIELSDDLPAYEKLMEESKPLQRRWSDPFILIWNKYPR